MTAEMLYPTELIAGILSNLPSNKKLLSTELRKLHPIFFQMKSSCPATLGDIIFDQRGTFPYSEEIDQAFSNLETAKVLPRRNPDLNDYEITEKLKAYYAKYVEKKLSENQLSEIKKIASSIEPITSQYQ